MYRTITYIVALSNAFHYIFAQMSQSYNPASAETDTVWAISTSLATTTEITFVFFSCAYLDVSVQRVRLLYGYADFICMGFPIRKCRDHEIFASPPALSQLITSFFASKSQGILHTPLLTFFVSHRLSLAAPG